MGYFIVYEFRHSCVAGRARLDGRRRGHRRVSLRARSDHSCSNCHDKPFGLGPVAELTSSCSATRWRHR
eukprot:45085-Pleurochrysis_carterae.AAC.1